MERSNKSLQTINQEPIDKEHHERNNMKNGRLNNNQDSDKTYDTKKMK